MKIQDILVKDYVGKKFIDNNKRIWKVITQGGCSHKYSLSLIKDSSEDVSFIGKQIEDLFFLSDIINLTYNSYNTLDENTNDGTGDI